jgi:hypothetical protein
VLHWICRAVCCDGYHWVSITWLDSFRSGSFLRSNMATVSPYGSFLCVSLSKQKVGQTIEWSV